MNDLHWLLDNDQESGYRARMILFRDQGYTVPEIRKITNHHDIITYVNGYTDSMRMVLMDCILSRKHVRNAHKITDDIERRIVEIVSTDPRKYKLKFSTWSLRVLVG